MAPVALDPAAGRQPAHRHHATLGPRCEPAWSDRLSPAMRVSPARRYASAGGVPRAWRRCRLPAAPPPDQRL